MYFNSINVVIVESRMQPTHHHNYRYAYQLLVQEGFDTMEEAAHQSIRTQIHTGQLVQKHGPAKLPPDFLAHLPSTSLQSAYFIAPAPGMNLLFQHQEQLY